MNSRDLARLEQWFDSYTHRHFCADPADQRNIDLKLGHSARVRGIIAILAEDLGLDPGQRLLAEAVGLFHDIGRFPQFTLYRTFRDNVSVNHGKLGAEVLKQEGVLAGLSAEEQDIITTAVLFHNAFAVPELQSADTVLFTKLARDADKLDIWRIFTGLFDMPEEERPSELGLGLIDSREYSPVIFDAVRLLQPVSDEEMKGDQPVNPADLGGIDPNAPATEISSYDESMDEAE